MGKLVINKELAEDLIEKWGNKNIFERGDFDDWKISDEELEEYDIEKAYTKREFVNGNGKRKSYWRTRIYEGIEGKQNKGKTKQITDISGEKLKNLLKIYKSRQSKHLVNQIDDIKKNGDWCIYHTKMGNTVKYDNSKNKIMENEPKKREFIQAKLLADRGMEVYLPKEPSKVKYKKNIDAIVNGVWVEFKYIDTANRQTAANEYLIKLQKCPNVFMYISKNSKDTAQSCMNAITGRAIQSANKTGILIIYDERSQRLIVRDLSKIKKIGGSKILKSSSAKVSYRNLDSSIITNSKNKSSNINKSLTYSGHKLQGRTKLYGMDISIENKKGSYRSGTDKDGHKWRTFMNYDYGYIRETVGTDGDHVDCYIGPYKDAEKVYVIHQNDPVTHKYDEDKCMLCFENAAAAKKAYMKQYDRPGFFGSMDIMTVENFKDFIFNNHGRRIHKSLTIEITDITEENKQQKTIQFEKSLNALYSGKEFRIRHIAAGKNERKLDPGYLENNIEVDYGERKKA